MRNPIRVLAALQAYDCERTIAGMVHACRAHVPDVLVVDDGSRDATADAARRAGAWVLRHPRNLGKGAAIAAAANEALRGGFTALLTVDADGQHDGADLPRFLEAHQRSPGTLWVGWRRGALGRAPRARRLGNRFSNYALRILAGVGLPDTQCGLRLYPVELLRRLSLRGSRYEAEAELLVKAAALGWSLQPLPVNSRFEDGRPTSHYRPWSDTARICASVTGEFLRRRLATPAGLCASALVAHAPLAGSVFGLGGVGAAAATALAFHAVVATSLLGPGNQIWVDTEVDFRPRPGRAEVALTFDDGPDLESTPRVLRILEREGVEATFFVIGRRVEANPQVVAEAVDRGHAVGNHTYSHPKRFSLLSRPRLGEEIDRAQDAVERACGRRPIHLRPPAGHRNPFLAQTLRERGLRCVNWSARAFDTVRRDPSHVAQALVRRARPGSILLLHDTVCGRPSMDSALPRLIEGLRSRGFSFVTLPGAA